MRCPPVHHPTRSVHRRLSHGSVLTVSTIDVQSFETNSSFQNLWISSSREFSKIVWKVCAYDLFFFLLLKMYYLFNLFHAVSFFVSSFIASSIIIYILKFCRIIDLKLISRWSLREAREMKNKLYKLDIPLDQWIFPRIAVSTTRIHDGIARKAKLWRAFLAPDYISLFRLITGGERRGGVPRDPMQLCITPPLLKGWIKSSREPG